MKLPWIIAAATFGIAAYLLRNQSAYQLSASGTDLDDAAAKTGTWGTEQRVKGTGGDLLGKAKQGAGKLTGDKQLQGEGIIDEATGIVKDTAGKAADAVSSTLHDLNKS